MSDPVIAFVGLGANLGDAAATVRDTLRELDALSQTRLLRASRLYRSRAWGVQAQPDFINAVAMLESRLPARTLLDELLAIERGHGRDREAETRWGPRTLDLDLLLYGEAIIDEPGLRVPHPHLHERGFAMLPLVEVAPDAVIPGRGLARDIAAVMADDGIQALG